MSSTDVTERIPLAAGADGVIRIAATRVTLETLIRAFESGATPEEIAQQYPSLMLADIYSVIAHYLRHRPEIQDYLDRRQRDGTQVRQLNEVLQETSGIRERLLARR